MSKMKICPFQDNTVCLKDGCMVYISAINECVFTGINRTLFKITELQDEANEQTARIGGINRE